MQLATAALSDDEKRHLQILETLRDELPECIFTGDSTQLIYSGNMIFNTDGGIQFVLGELGACKDAGVPVAVVVWCNGGYREIKTSMERAEVTAVGVEFTVPDFTAVAEAYGIDAVEVDDEQQLGKAINESFKLRTPVLIVVDEQKMLKISE